MSKESLHTFEKSVIFRETFNSEFDVRKNGGDPVDVSFSDGIGSFNGSSSNIKYSPKNIGKEFTIRMKIKILTPEISYLFTGGLNGASSTTHGFYFISDTTTFHRIGISAAGSSRLGTTGGITGIVGEWHDITFSISKVNNFVKFYLDDIDVGSDTYIPALDSLLNDFIAIGARTFYSAEYANIDIDLLEIYNTALTAEEVANLYNNISYRDIRNGLLLDIDARGGVIQDEIGNSLTINSGTSVKKDNVYTSYFNGTSLGISVGSLPTTNVTYSLWAKLNPYSSPTLQQLRHSLFGSGTGGTKRVDITNNSPYTLYSVLGGNVNIVLNKSTALWNMYTITLDASGVMKVYFNGEYTGLTSSGNSLLATMYFGSYQDASFYKMRGYQNQQRIYNRVLSAAEITQLYTSQKRNYE